MNTQSHIRAVGLLSGGLDSILATRVILEQGIHVTALHFRTGFSFAERQRAYAVSSLPSDAERAAATLGVPLEIIDVSEEFRSLVLNPQFGYGSGMNPCVDCRIFLLRQAKMWMETHGGHFIFTGEVIGQRPKSQMPPSLRTVERESGLTGSLLRPLSAKLLPPTVPETRGWVDREQLYAISGRGRKDQIALAERFGITDYPQPSGGCCYLIDRTYAHRLQDFLAHEGADALTDEQVQLLAVGRHLRTPSGRKIVVGRHEQENKHLAGFAVEGRLLTSVDHPGPITLVTGSSSQCTAEVIELAAQITAGYSDGHTAPIVRISMRAADGSESKMLTVRPLSRSEIKKLMI
jgi:tRNA U34 2-thiouridine synthase MnmA/TrmU